MLEFRLTRPEVYGDEKKSPGRHNTGCRSGHNVRANSAKEAVLIYAENAVVGNNTPVFDATINNIVQLPPTPTMI